MLFEPTVFLDLYGDTRTRIINTHGYTEKAIRQNGIAEENGGLHRYDQCKVWSDAKAYTNNLTYNFYLQVSNAGTVHFKNISTVTEEDYDDMFNTNCKAHVFLTKLVMPHLIKSKGK